MNDPLSGDPNIAVEQPACVVLVSGGIDSTACVDFYKRHNFEVSGIHINYGQPASSQECIAAKTIAEHYGLPLTVLTLSGARPKSVGEVIGRNAFLLFAASTELESYPALIALGIHSGTPYFDCSTTFFSKMQELLDGQCEGRLRVAAPFIEWDKFDIWNYCREHEVPIEMTYSCEQGLQQPCGQCRSCKDWEILRAC